MSPALLVLVSAVALGAPAPPGEDVYTWTDSEGVAHYTNDPNLVPGKYRDQARSLEGQPLPEDTSSKSPPPPETKPGPAAEVQKADAPKPAGRNDEPPPEASPSPSLIPPTGTAGLDEAGWRRLFQKANEQVRRAELALARDREALARVANEDGYLVVDPFGRVTAGGRAGALRLQVSEDERVVHDAREALYELERVAAREAIPLDWRH
ncbi:MAG TPA: DUF4124 domain-containing protein [Myxococcaceae bacterium]|nr:DUF4124 domain-containing protein [Myxococcaceae bacterium]